MVFNNTKNQINPNKGGYMLPTVLNIQIKVEVNPNIRIEPHTEVGPDDKVLGDVNSRQKELFVLAMQLQITANNNLETANAAHGSMKNLLEMKANELLEKSEIIMKAFIIDVMDAHDLWMRYNEIDIGIRRGWIVVWTEAVEEEIAPYVINASNN